MKRLSCITLFLLNLALCGCGGGGGGDGTNKVTGGDTSQINTQPGTAVLHLFTNGTIPAGKAISGIHVVVGLPAGVNVKLTSSTALDISPSGVTSGKAIISPDPDPANMVSSTTTAGGQVGFYVLSTEPLGLQDVGEFVTITCTTPTGAQVQVSQFSLTVENVRDMGGASISALDVIVGRYEVN